MATFTLPPKSSRSNLCPGWKRTWVMWSRTTPPDKPTETDAPPQTCPRTPTRTASPPTMGLSSVAKQSPGRSTRECLAPPTRDPPSSPQLRYQWARPRPSSSTSYHCARGERIPTDLARETPSPAPPSLPLLAAAGRRPRVVHPRRRQYIPAVLLLSLQAQYCNSTVRSYPMCCTQPTHHSFTGTMGELA